MPETEPTPWELMRVLREIKDDVKSIRSEALTKEAFREEQRHVHERLEDLGSEIADERTARKEALAAAVADRKIDVARVDLRIDRAMTWIKWVAASIMVPVALFVAGLVLSRGGA